MRRPGLGIQPGRPGSWKRLLYRRTETLSAARFRREPPIPQGRRLPSSSARSRRLASPCKRRSRNCSKRKSSSRLSGRGGRFDAKWFSLRRKPFFRQGGSWAGAAWGGSSCGGWAGRGVQRFLPLSRTANHRLKSETSSQNILITEPIQHYSARELKGEGIRLHLSRAADYERITGKQEVIL